jgi:hypothetical protein
MRVWGDKQISRSVKEIIRLGGVWEGIERLVRVLGEEILLVGGRKEEEDEMIE